MGENLTIVMRFVHLTSAVVLVGGIVYARFVMIPSAASLAPEARTALDEHTSRRFRPMAFAAMACLVLSGIFNYFVKTGHSVRYSALFGVKMLLALHVFSVAILATAPKNPRRARQLLGAAVSGLAIILIAAYLARTN
jgi:uncharacterized membrane protein